MSELLESVKHLAEAQKSGVPSASHFDWPALAKHIARLERVEAAAMERHAIIKELEAWVSA